MKKSSLLLLSALVILITLFILASSKLLGGQPGYEILPPKKSPGGPSGIKPAVTTMVLHGQPKGGEIILWIEDITLKVKTDPSESPNQIAEKIATMVNVDTKLKEMHVTARVNRNEITFTTKEAWVFLCTTDYGLDQPHPPLSLTIEKVQDGINILHWQIPKGGYDRIHVLRGTTPIGEDLRGTTTSFPDYEQVIGTGMYTYRVFGIKNKTPSCAAMTEVFLKSP